MDLKDKAKNIIEACQGNLFSMIDGESNGTDLELAVVKFLENIQCEAYTAGAKEAYQNSADIADSYVGSGNLSAHKEIRNRCLMLARSLSLQEKEK